MNPAINKKLLAMTAEQRKQAEKLDKALKQQQRKQRAQRPGGWGVHV